MVGSIAAFAQPRAGAGAIVAIEEGVGGAPQQGAGRSGSSPTGGSSKKTTTTSRQSGGQSTKKPTATVATRTAKPKPFSGPILGDKYTFLNFEVVDQVKPVHTNAAKAAGAKGLVQVEILVETDGRVLSVRARTGNKLLWPEAERAALASRLNRPSDNGRPARATGFLVYRFGPAEDDD